MLARIRKSMQERDQGFTLIELLVVMIIIGILAAIAIPTFLNQRQKARETSAKADVTTIGKEVAAYYVDGEGGLTADENATDSTTWELTSDVVGEGVIASGALSAGNTVSGTATDGTDFCVTVTPEQPGSAWSYSEAGLVKGSSC